MPKLKSGKHEQFCQEYIVEFNGAKSATDAGFNKKSARTIACRLLTKVNIQERIAELMKDRSERTQVTQDMVVKELAIIGFSDFTKFARYTKKDGLVLENTKDIKGERTRAIQSMKQTTSKDGGSISIKLHGKEKPLELLGKHLGIFVDMNIKGKFKHEHILSMKDFKESVKKMGEDEKSGP